MARARDTDIVLTKPPSIAWSKIFSCCRPPPSSKVLTVENHIVKDDEDCNRDDTQIMSTSCHQHYIDADKSTIDAEDKSYSSISLSYSIDKSMRVDSSAVKVKDTSVLDSLKKSIIFEEDNKVLMDNISDERDDELLQGGRGDSVQCSREETTGVETLQRKIKSLEMDLANKSSKVERLQKELETAAFLSSVTEEEEMRKEIGIILNTMKWMKHDVLERRKRRHMIQLYYCLHNFSYLMMQRLNEIC